MGYIVKSTSNTLKIVKIHETSLIISPHFCFTWPVWYDTILPSGSSELYSFFSFLFTTKDFDSHYFEMKTLPRNIKHLSKLETKRTWFVKIWPANCLLKTGLNEDTLMTVKLRQPSWFCSKWLYWPQHKQRQNRIMGLLVVILASNSKKVEREIS